MKFNIDDRLKPIPSLLYGVQWLVVIIPSIITIGLVLGKVHFGTEPESVIFYMQKLLFVLGLTLLVQVLAGHRLPLVVGPASVLLIGVLASQPASMGSVYTAIIVGGGVLVLLSWLGLLKYSRRVFTPRVILVIILLIPLTLGPTLLTLIFAENTPVLFDLFFVILMCILLLLLNKWLKGIWKSTTLLLGMIAGTIVYRLILNPEPAALVDGALSPDLSLFITPEWDLGVILAFLFCTVALTINEVGSVEAVGQMLGADNMGKRTRRGVGITGVANMLAGALGVVGPIDYSSSPGIIASTGCASRFPFIPTGLMLILLAFFPPFVRGLLTVPDIVMGTILLYVMTSQFGAGFQMITGSRAIRDFNDGVGVGLALMIAMLTSFIPSDISMQIPSVIRPVLCNGFVMGVIIILVMEHLIYRKKAAH